MLSIALGDDGVVLSKGIKEFDRLANGKFAKLVLGIVVFVEELSDGWIILLSNKTSCGNVQREGFIVLGKSAHCPEPGKLDCRERGDVNASVVDLVEITNVKFGWKIRTIVEGEEDRHDDGTGCRVWRLEVVGVESKVLVTTRFVRWFAFVVEELEILRRWV